MSTAYVSAQWSRDFVESIILELNCYFYLLYPPLFPKRIINNLTAKRKEGVGQKPRNRIGKPLESTVKCSFTANPT